MMRVLTATAMLTIVYALALASRDPWDLGIGAMLGLGVTLSFRSFLFHERETHPLDLLHRAARLPALVAATASEIVRGTIIVARAVLSPQPPKNDGFVNIPEGERSPTGVIVSAWLNTLSPGSVYVGDDLEPGSWTIHALDTSDEPAIRDNARRFYERYQRPVWP